MTGRPLRVAALIKQIPRFEQFSLGADGRLSREGVELEINPYCRRALGKGVDLARETGGTCTVFSLGPPTAEAALREAVAAGADRAVHICDPEFAGSDTLATARVLAAALRHMGSFDLILVGLNSVDADTGQVGPELAQLLDLPFVSGVRSLDLDAGQVAVGCERDDGWLEARVALPALISVAERLCPPAKAAPEACAAVRPQMIERLSASQLGNGPWGAAGSPTSVGRVRIEQVTRVARRGTGGIEAQVDDAVATLVERGALEPSLRDRTVARDGDGRTVPSANGAANQRPIGVLAEPGRPGLAAELMGGATTLSAELGSVVALLGASQDVEVWAAGSSALTQVEWPSDGADYPDEEAVSAAVSAWAEQVAPWALLGPATSWGRHVMSRVAARLGAGLIGDAVGLEFEHGRLTAWKPAFGGYLVAAISTSSAVQMVTVRPGVLTPLEVPASRAGAIRSCNLAPLARGRVKLVARSFDWTVDRIRSADVLVGVGMGVAPEGYEHLQPLVELLGAELVATRKVTDRGWLGRNRQVGVTGLAVAPRLYVAVGIGGSFNHLVGARAAGTILAINSNPAAPIFDTSDIGIIGDWRVVVPLLAEGLRHAVAQRDHVRPLQGREPDLEVSR